MKDLRFTKEHAYCDFSKAETNENIKSGESLRVILGKIAGWIDNSIKSVSSDVGRFWVNENGKKCGEIFNDYEHNVASGENSHAEGYSTTASGINSHAEGVYTVASDVMAHAEGMYSIASGNSSHAEGANNTASAYCSHAEGQFSTASSYCSHAEGCYTIAASNYQHVEGKYNIEDAENKYAHIIGNGISEENRSNALAIDWEGKIYIGNSATGINLLDLVSRIETLEAKAESSINEISENEIGNIC